MVRANHKTTGTFLFRALCGVDTAIWDLLGKVAGVPVYQLIGGAVRTSIPVYGSSLRRDLAPHAEAERLQALVESHGFRAFKVKVAEMMGRDTDAWPGRSVELVRTVRGVLGPDVVLHADANAATPQGRRFASDGSSKSSSTATSRSRAPSPSSSRRPRSHASSTSRSRGVNRTMCLNSSTAWSQPGPSTSCNPTSAMSVG